MSEHSPKVMQAAEKILKYYGHPGWRLPEAMDDWKIELEHCADIIAGTGADEAFKLLDDAAGLIMELMTDIEQREGEITVWVCYSCGVESDKFATLKHEMSCRAHNFLTFELARLKGVEE